MEYKNWSSLEYFSRKDFSCNGSECCHNSSPISLVMVHALNAIQNELGVSMGISSGYRCKKYNALIKRPKLSLHTYGLAADVYCIDPSNTANILELAKKLKCISPINPNLSVNVFIETCHDKIRNYVHLGLSPYASQILIKFDAF